MPFPEPIKLEAKRKAHFACVICRQPFVEVHHIIPQAVGGPDTLDNAAPLCAGCHSYYGGNPDKRKQIKEMRDFWYDLCATRYTNSPLFQLNQSIDEIKNTQQEQSAMLSGVKALFEGYLQQQIVQVANATTPQQFAIASGVAIIPDHIDDSSVDYGR
jgi:hypothetical protein